MKDKKLIILVGAPGSGKTYWSKFYGKNFIRISQDERGSKQYLLDFRVFVDYGLNIIVDRTNPSKEQRAKFIGYAKEKGYDIEAIIFNTSKEVSKKRALERKNHETIKDGLEKEDTIEIAQRMFYTNYEEPKTDEGIDRILTIYEDIEDINSLFKNRQ